MKMKLMKKIMAAGIFTTSELEFLLGTIIEG